MGSALKVYNCQTHRLTQTAWANNLLMSQRGDAPISMLHAWRNLSVFCYGAWSCVQHCVWGGILPAKWDTDNMLPFMCWWNIQAFSIINCVSFALREVCVPIAFTCLANEAQEVECEALSWWPPCVWTGECQLPNAVRAPINHAWISIFLQTNVATKGSISNALWSDGMLLGSLECVPLICTPNQLVCAHQTKAKQSMRTMVSDHKHVCLHVTRSERAHFFLSWAISNSRICTISPHSRGCAACHKLGAP